MGTIGDIGTFSFFPGKNLGIDGGALVTNSKKIYNKALRLRNHGAVINTSFIPRKKFKIRYNSSWST